MDRALTMDKTKLRTFPASVAVLTMLMAGYSSRPGMAASVEPPGKSAWGKTPDGRDVEIYTLRNRKGAEARIMNYGGVVVSLKVPDRRGTLGDIVAGFDKFQDYLKPPPYFGAIIGRYGNRIGNARFSLNGVEYVLARNDGANQLHGGPRGFDKRLWQASLLTPQSLELKYRSKDGEEGYPGNVSATVRYTLTDANELKIEYSAITDKDTVINLTNHSYFNLAGDGDILAHELMDQRRPFYTGGQGAYPYRRTEERCRHSLRFSQSDAHRCADRTKG